jgi:hypothetical protein
VPEQTRAPYIWPDLDHGYRRALDSAGAVVAPLLAGFSFTLLVLLLPSLSEKTTTVVTPSGVRVTEQTEPFSAYPELAAVLLLSAGLLLIASVQAAVSMRKHAHTPGEMREWYPEAFREVPSGEKPAKAPQSFWRHEGWESRGVDGQWSGGWVRWKLNEELNEAHRWAEWLRGLYHCGILCLLAGLTALVAPPADDSGGWRTLLVAVALLGTLGELIWIIATSRVVRLAAGRARRVPARDRSTAAAPKAGTSG